MLILLEKGADSSIAESIQSVRILHDRNILQARLLRIRIGHAKRRYIALLPIQEGRWRSVAARAGGVNNELFSQNRLCS
jgi:hypothetical protein